MANERPDPRFVLALAARAPCDPRTARRFAMGESIRGDLLRARLKQAASELDAEFRTEEHADVSH